MLSSTQALARRTRAAAARVRPLACSLRAGASAPARAGGEQLHSVAAPHAAPLGDRGQPRRISRGGEALRVLTLNLAHGRADGPHQLLQSRASRRTTLQGIAGLLAREQPDVVGLQEVDGPSFWSGGFCHLGHLARLTGFPFAAHGEHVSRRWLRYGTALLSADHLLDPHGFTFAPSPPTPSKGFTRGTIVPGLGRAVDVVSVHLDFYRLAVRRQQVDQMLEVLSPRRQPLVVMGDFNAGWEEEGSAVRRLAERLDLVPHAPGAPGGAEGVQTFPGSRKRLDWVLVSRELVFERYRVLPDVVSDHLPVVADLRWR